VQLITRLHGSIKYFGKELNRPYSRYISFFEKMQLRKSDLLIGVSKYVHIKTLEYFSIKKPSIVIYNAVRLRDIRIEFESSQRPKEILYFGSIIPKKGVEELVLAFNSISNERNNLSLKLIGKSNAEKNGMSYTDYLLSLLSEVNKGRLQILSHLQSEDLKNEIQNSYCCVFPSFVECFAIAPMEAMALGRPVIYSTLHSGPELIEDGVDGILVDPNNIMVLAEKIMYLISNPQIAEEMGVNGRRKIEEKFSFDSWIKLNVEMYIALKRNNI
jgi:glycosyltransferase involved in cell wall biosynthesis